ncbi:MAG: hypothetical protein WD738_14005 [Pirellulales bacterium]
MDTLFTLAALIGGTVLVFQFVLMLLGMGGDSDMTGADGGHFAGGDHFGGADVGSADVGGVDVGSVDVGGTDMVTDHPTWHEAADADLGHPQAPWFYEVLSLRTLSAAVTFFGLAGKTALAYAYSPLGSFVLATVVGLAAMYIVYWLFKQVYKLQHTGTENIRNAIGASAVVYVPVPGQRAGVGKVTFRMQNRLVEYQAVTEDENRLPTGEKVVVVAIVNSDTVRVARATSPVPDMVPTNTTA